jgi:thioredoxin-like negative regulator of GroEL
MPCAENPFARQIAFGAFILCGCGAASSATPVTHAVLAPAQVSGARIPFIHDDFARARALSAEGNLPLFVEAHAPWCNTCSFMAAMLEAPAIAKYARSFVWLDLELDDARNDDFFAHYPAKGLPKLYVFDAGGALTASWTGLPNEDELAAFLDDAAPSRATGAADEALRFGDREAGRGDDANAARAYRHAIELGGSAWPRRADAQARLVASLQLSNPAACVEEADADIRGLSRTRAFVSIASTGLACALDPEARAPGNARARLEVGAAEAVALEGADEDARFSLYGALIAARNAAGDAAGAARYASRYWDYVRSLPVPPQGPLRTARDYGRLAAATALGNTALVTELLEATERAMPDSCIASQHLAAAYLGTGRFADAIEAATRALAKRPAPQDTTKLLILRARAESGAADVASARRDLVSAKESASRITSSAHWYIPGLSRSIDVYLRELGPSP